MMVILSDTTEEEDEHINDWLINEKLARCGKMVCMCDNFSYFHYLTCNDITMQPTMPIAHVKKFGIASDTDDMQYDKDQSISYNKETHTLFNVKSESKTVKALHNILPSKKALLQKLQDINSPNAESDTKSQSTNSSKNEKSSGPRKLAKLLEKLKTLNVTSNSNSNISTPKSSHDFKDNVQIDSDIKANSQDDNKNFKHCALNMDFGLRDSDDEENNEKDFGTFRSLYGGHGLMEPFDWSVIKENDDFVRDATATSHNNLDILIKEYKNNVTEDESHNLNNLEDKSLPVNLYFLNFARKEEEYFLPENNINYDFKNVSQAVARLRNRMEVQNNKYTTVVVPRNILETLCGNAQSQDILSPDINTVKTNGVTSPVKMTAQSKIIDENHKARETRIEDKTENNSDFDTDMKSNSSNMINNEDCKDKTKSKINEKMFEYNTDSSSDNSTTGKVFNPRYKVLLDKMRRVQMDSNTSKDLSNKGDSPSSEQIQSSSYSSSTTSSTMISSDDEQHEDSRSQSSTCVTKLYNFSKLLSTSSSDFSLDCNSKESRGLLSSENDSVSSFNVNDFKQNQLAEIDSIASTVDNLKQPNITIKMPRISKMLELVLKKAENATSDIELDSDDLSNQESVASDKNCDEKRSELVDELVTDDVKCKSTSNDINMLEKISVPPMLNDCDMESDNSEWDVCVQPILDVEDNEYNTDRISDDESERI